MTLQNDRLVYVVDDDEAVRDSTVTLLEAEDFAATGFASPDEFLQEFDAARAGCLILDIHMPQMNGIELLAMLRARGVTTPAVVLTGRSDPALEEAARRGGASILNKPPRDEDLLALVQGALGRPRAK